MSMGKHFPLFPVLLILVGALLLLDRLDILAFGWWSLLWGVIAMVGAYKVAAGLRSPGRGGIVWGTIWFFVGLYFVLDEANLIRLPGGAEFPLLLVVVGCGFLLSFLRQWREWHLAVPAVAFLGIGGVMLLAEFGYLGRWMVLDAIRQWWPLALVLFGAALLMNRGTARRPS